jgi:predicted CXXCH cytochrome family protein
VRKYSRIGWITVALGLIVCAATAIPAHAQRRECVDCHEDFKNVLKRSHVHAPAKQDCETCHKRHGFTQKLVLTENMPDLCTGCHEDVKAEMGAGHVHDALTKGGCTFCHDPHASDNKGLLRTEATQAELCVTCHEDLAPVRAEKDLHDPFKKGNCSACHAPHSSSEAGLLVAKESDLCATCHKDIGTKHKKIAGMEDYACSSCHDPHRSTKKSKLAATAHPPFASGDCESCHTMDGGQITIADDFPPKDLCETCHDGEAGKVAGAASHFGTAEMASKGTAACLECHDPHVSGRPAMLVADQNTLCRKCHESLPEMGKTAGFLHVPFARAECTTCHDPHGSSAPHKLVKSSNDLCSGCHTAITAAVPKGMTAHPAMESMVCTDCHSGHAGKDESLLTRAIGEVCSDCHDKEVHRQGHMPYQTGECGVCHKNHSHEKGLLAGPVNETCGQCHGAQIRAMSEASQHPPVKEDGCLLCHKPHGSENEGLLVEGEKSLCTGCHDIAETVVRAGDKATAKGEAALHAPVANGECSSCHAPHGSPDKPLLARTGDALCFGCHAQEKLDFSAGKVHAPVADGRCDVCHTAHGSENGDLAALPQPAMCVKCHDFKETALQEAHKKIDVSTARCTSCHAPHSSPSESLLNAVVHPPFADGDCETCHELKTTAAGLTELGAVSETLCFDCHDDKQSGKGHQHVEGVACTECHQPHSSPFKNLLNRPDKLCTGCHDDILRVAGKGDATTFIHKPIDTGCQECHKLHDSPAEPFLKVAQKDLCSGCHESVKVRTGDKTQHQPFAKGECSKCHETHVASEKNMLKTAKTDLCQSCHDLKAPAMAAKHDNMPLTGRACTSCHDPHSTRAAGSGLVYATKHPPYEDKDCAVCHDEKGVATTTVTACLECHDGQNGYSNVHNGRRSGPDAASVGICLDCHSPHAGNDKLLVRPSVMETCVQCHDRAQFTRQYRHAALDEGCDACHNVHDNDMAKLRGADANQLCAGCHDVENVHSHVVTGVPDPRSGEPLRCISCHEVHSADHEKMLKFDQKRDLCVQCHSAGMH